VFVYSFFLDYVHLRVFARCFSPFFSFFFLFLSWSFIFSSRSFHSLTNIHWNRVEVLPSITLKEKERPRGAIVAGDFLLLSVSTPVTQNEVSLIFHKLNSNLRFPWHEREKWCFYLDFVYWDHVFFLSKHALPVILCQGLFILFSSKLGLLRLFIIFLSYHLPFS
jgi:hypothetical protein